MANFSDFYPEVLPEVDGCPNGLALNALRNAAIEFCEKTLVYSHLHSAISAVAAQAQYPFVPPADTVVIKIMKTWYDEKVIYPKDQDELNTLYTDWRNQDGTPFYYTQDDKRNVLLVPYPSALLADALVMRVTLKPSRAALTIIDEIYEEYGEAISSGAKARLMMMEGDNIAWTNRKQAGTYMTLFRETIDETKARVAKSFTRSRQRVRAHFS